MASSRFRSIVFFAGFSGLSAVSAGARADEGMWPFDMVPKERIQKDHGVVLTDAWLDHVRLSTVKFGNATGSFVSSTGLLLTNHHVGSGCIGKVSRAGKDYMGHGYLAGRDGPEAACPDTEINVLLAIDDVTEKVRAARKPDMNDADANAATKSVMTQLEKSCTEAQIKAGRPAAHCDVVTLYAGGKYALYTYQRYTDVRLVFAPEYGTADFGGDADNFNYPRFALDMAIFRVYENGQPLEPKDYLSFNAAGAKEGDTVFVSGNPYNTERMLTMAELGTQRDTVYPYMLEAWKRALGYVRAYTAQGAEPARETTGITQSLLNGIKAVTGYERGLHDPSLMKKKAEDELSLRRAVDADPKLKASYGSVWDDIAATQKKREEIFKRYAALESVDYSSSLMRIARGLVRLPAELEQPDDKRLREYRESNLPGVRRAVFSPAPIYGEIEVAIVRGWLERAARDLGQNDATIAAVLAGRTPERAAREIVAGSKLFDVYARRALEAGGKEAVARSTDPAIVAMRTIDPEARAIRKRMEDEVEGPSRKQGERIAQATFAVKGTDIAPDATGTLRFGVGVVKGYTEGGKTLPWATTIAGLYTHATGVPPLKLSEKWVAAKPTLDPNTPFDFVSTLDTIGGNSGSPVLNAAGELVGLNFDSNLSKLSNNFLYRNTTQRAIHVHPALIVEALKKVYGADALAQELLAKP